MHTTTRQWAAKPDSPEQPVRAEGVEAAGNEAAAAISDKEKGGGRGGEQGSKIFHSRSR